ncbi:MAG: hypothetical protein GX180_04635 [Enterococcus sp.]|nr:hypothetical protein [Enterococcus sp.]
MVASKACPYLQARQATQEYPGWTHVVDLTYLNNIPGCAGFLPFYIEKTKCYELGSENPLKPLTPGIPQTDGKWVRVIFTMSNGATTYDSTVQTVLSGGCSGVEIDGEKMRKSNAYDSSFTIDGATINICSYDDTIYSGTCAENGLNTGCGGQVPFTYNNNNDSILNDCFGYGSVNDLDTFLKRPGSDLQIQSDTSVTGSQYASGINNLASEMRAENALNRDISNKQLEEQKKSNNLLNTLKGALAGISNSIKNLLSIPDSASKSSKLSEYENGGLIDSTGFDLNIGDSLQIIQDLRGRYIEDTLTDTIDYQVDSAGISEIFEGFSIDFGESDCDCNPEWFRIEVPNFTEFYIDICPYNIDTWCKYIFKILGAIVLFVFYRNSIYKTLDELFK